MVPSETFPRHLIKIPSNIKLADPEFHLPRSVDLLIGAGTTLSLFSIGQINLSQGNHDLYLQKTRLGWIVVGGITSRNRLKNAICQLTNLEQQIAKFLTIEEISSETLKSPEKLECEEHFIKNVTRDESRRYKAITVS